jgi:hypothetical protein
VERKEGENKDKPTNRVPTEEREEERRISQHAST